MAFNIASLTELSWLGILLLLGLGVSVISLKLKVADVFLLILLGLGLGYFLKFPAGFLAGLGTFALIMLVFTSTSQFKLREVNELYPQVLKLVFLFLIANLVIFSIITHLLYGQLFTVKNFLISLIFAGLMAGTSADVVLAVFKNKVSKVVEMLQFESILNTPFTILIPIVIFNIYQGVFQAGDVFLGFLQSIMTGIGTGLFLGLVIFRLMKKTYVEDISPLLIIAVSLVSYSLAEVLGGNGVLSVTTLAIVYGASQLKEKKELTQFANIFANFLKIIVFILLGVVIKIPLDPTFLVKATLLFLIYLSIRFFTLKLAFPTVNIKERWFMTLNVAKGVGVAVVVFIIAAAKLPEFDIILNLSFVFILYSIILSSIVAKFADRFLLDIKEKKPVTPVQQPQQVQKPIS
ncbi:cation:proton antiporter [archaeon]|nr:cation:proton antiporter [archaeon]